MRGFYRGDCIFLALGPNNGQLFTKNGHFPHRGEKNEQKKAEMFLFGHFQMRGSREAPKWLALINNNAVRMLPSQNFDLLPWGLIVVVTRCKIATFHTNFHK